MKPVVYDLAAGAVQVAATITVIVTAIHAAGIQEAFLYTGWMLALEVATGFVAMFLMAFIVGAAFQLLSRHTPLPPVVSETGGESP